MFVFVELFVVDSSVCISTGESFSWMDISLSRSVMDLSPDISTFCLAGILLCILLIKSRTDMKCNIYDCVPLFVDLSGILRLNSNTLVSFYSFIHTIILS